MLQAVEVDEELLEELKDHAHDYAVGHGLMVYKKPEQESLPSGIFKEYTFLLLNKLPCIVFLIIIKLLHMLPSLSYHPHYPKHCIGKLKPLDLIITCSCMKLARNMTSSCPHLKSIFTILWYLIFVPISLFQCSR